MTETVTETGAEIAVQESDDGLVGELTKLARLPEGSISLIGLSLTDSDMTYEDWTWLGRVLGTARRWTSWAIGDWYNFGEALYGESDAAQASEGTRSERQDVLRRVTGLAPQTLANYSSVCARVPMSIRRVELDFGVHDAVAALDHDEQREWLQKAVDEGWGRDELRQAIRDAKKPPSEEGGEDGALEVPRSIRERIEDAARLCYNVAQPTSDGGALIPAEAWAQLAEALGEE